MIESKIKANFRCPEEDKNRFKNSSCSITISVGQEYHESDKFYSTIELVNKNFKECTVVVCDTHQRYNFNSSLAMLDYSNYEHSKLLGDQWLKRNKPALDLLTIPHAITRWDYWLEHPNMSQKLNIVNDAYKNKSLFKEDIESAAEIFIERYKKRTESDILTLRRLYELSVEYLLEECAAMLLWADEGFNYEIYPSRRNKAMSATYQYLIEPYHQNRVRPVALVLRTKNKYRLDNLVELACA